MTLKSSVNRLILLLLIGSAGQDVASEKGTIIKYDYAKCIYIR